MAAEGLGQVVSWYICTIVAIGFLAARLVVRWQRLASLFLEDLLLCIAGLCLVGDLAIQHYMWTLGLAASDPRTVPFENVIAMMKMIVPGSTLYVTSLWLVKLALVIFYKKIAAPGTNMQVAYNVTLAFLLCSWLAIFLDILFQCFPHDKRWSQDPDYMCDPRQSEINYWLTVVLNIFSDIVIICLPIAMVMNLQMKMKQKIGVAAIFALGIFVVIASIIRAYYSHKGEQFVTCTVSMVEATVAIVAACLPPLRVLILGQPSTAASGSYDKRYELSYFNTSGRKGGRSRNTGAGLGGTSSGGGGMLSGSNAGGGGGGGSNKSHISHHNKSSPSNDSEDELVFKQHGGLPSPTGATVLRSAAASSVSDDDIEGISTAGLGAAPHHTYAHPSQRYHRTVVESGGGGGSRNGRTSPSGGGTAAGAHGRSQPPSSSPPAAGAGFIVVNTTIEMDKSDTYYGSLPPGRQ
ncbi:alpha-methylacyl-CoA racemase [Microdochium nivale]|nr:alpha-methylacyl-CoA racemase [Microdochium nivale]